MFIDWKASEDEFKSLKIKGESMVLRTLLIVSSAALLSSCGGDDTPPFTGGPNPTPTSTSSPTPTPVVVTIDHSFATQDTAWVPGYSDYQGGMDIDFVAVYEQLPPNLTSENGLRLQGQNRSDDLAMYVTREVGSLVPGQSYRVDASVRFGTSAAEGCIGAGGSPGDSVALKIGALPRVPATITNEEGLLVLDVDKGDQLNSGTEAVMIGTIGSPDLLTCDGSLFAAKTLSSEGAGPVVKADDQGRLWLLVTTDSGFEGLNVIYLLSAEFTLTPV